MNNFNCCFEEGILLLLIKDNNRKFYKLQNYRILMANDKYGIIEPRTKFEVRKLLVVPHKEGSLTVSYPVFGSNTYNGNIEKMSKNYSHPKTGKKMTFVPATTSESISAINPDVEKYPELTRYTFGKFAKPQIFDLNWFQAGYIVKTQDGVYVNTTELNEKNLKNLINKSEKVNGIYILPNGTVEGVKDFAFAPYESFETGVQESGKFAEGGLARALEHTSEKVAKKLKEISSSDFYKLGVNLGGFESVKEPVLRVANLGSSWNARRGNLLVSCHDLNGNDNFGYAFGVKSKVSRTKLFWHHEV